MKIVLAREKAEQIAEEAAELRKIVAEAGEWLEAVERQMKHGGNLGDMHLNAIANLNRAKTAENEFFRALYIIGVVGVKWVDYSDHRYTFDLLEALEELEGEGGAR